MVSGETRIVTGGHLLSSPETETSRTKKAPRGPGNSRARDRSGEPAGVAAPAGDAPPEWRVAGYHADPRPNRRRPRRLARSSREPCAPRRGPIRALHRL